MTTNSCPCGSGHRYDDCCGAIIRGARPARTAEELMRSRYTAFSQHNHAYLEASWHPDTRQTIEENEDELEKITWSGLTILNTKDGRENQDSGTVTFVARFTSEDGEHELCEKSQFRKQNGIWFYLSGEPSRPPVQSSKTSRNAACPCGSGKKYKRCCG